MKLDLFSAIRRNEPIAVEQLSPQEIIATNDDGCGLLHMAAAYGKSELVMPLVVAGADVNLRESSGMTPLHFAAANVDCNSVEHLLANGADPTIADKHGNTPLWTAVFNCKGRYYDIVKLLIVGGAAGCVDLKNKHNKSPRDFATQIGDKELVDILSGG